MNDFIYQGAKTTQISFPLGGIGAGSIGLAGNGRLIDWEIFNRPNKGSVNGFSHFAVRAEADGRVLDARVLHGDLAAPYQGELNGAHFTSYGWGPRREYLTGLPHFADTQFKGEYPLAALSFADARFPGEVTLRAFSPLIPLNDRDSSLPAAFFEYTVANTSDAAIDYTLAGVLANPLPANNRNTVSEQPWGHTLQLTSDSVEPGTTTYGDLTLATDGGRAEGASLSWQEYWFRGVWFDSLEVYWKDFTTPGPFQNRHYPLERAGKGNEGLLAVHFRLAPGESKAVRFVIAWNFPVCENYWKPEQTLPAGVSPTWKNYYATVWPDSQASAAYAIAQWDRLYAETQRFHDALFASDLPPAALDAISANMAILKSPTVLRLEDGTFYGWEGCHPDAGCCEGSCTHVWNYQQTLPFLFPALERSMREADFRYNLRPDGGMAFRLQLPLGAELWEFRPCADGQFGGVLKTYRDWKICGDSEWLRRLWPAVKQSIDFAWHPDNEDRWDPEKTGVLWGRQHHTLDMELFEPNSWLTGMYLAALKAGAEMAEHLGDAASAAEYRAIFARGKAWADANLFNGEYYIQRIDLHDRAVVEAFAGDGSVLVGGSTMEAYWDEEHQEIKYQIGDGSSIDQLLGQWHASLYGLGEIFDPVQVRSANAAIYRHNFIPVMGEVYNPCRIYCLNDEGGLVICAWPAGTTKPTIPAPYSQETMNGFEYAAAIHMIMDGLVDEGMTCVEAIRRRYDGERRNPWNEFECGSNYARSMAAYALLNAFAGFQFDMVRQSIAFQPVRTHAGSFRCFWSLDSGWGEFELTPGGAELRLLYGDLTLRSLALPLAEGQLAAAVRLDAEQIAFQQQGKSVQFQESLHIQPGSALTVTFDLTRVS
ncbi:MAG: GH116 family glycosyl-hydrolase [Caldilinea sp.]